MFRILKLHILLVVLFCLFFNYTATTEISTLSLHDAFRSCWSPEGWGVFVNTPGDVVHGVGYPEWSHRSYVVLVDDEALDLDRKSTRLNSSHMSTSYAVFCLKKKNINLSKNTIVSKVSTNQ